MFKPLVIGLVKGVKSGAFPQWAVDWGMRDI
jgi:hypothetical protein